MVHTKDIRQEKLEEIQQSILDDMVCPSLAETATQLVFGDGNPYASVVFIGEAPGKNEDLQGKPFVGAAGKFLDELLATVGLKRNDIYITNIVKYRPPNNRDPLPDEKSAFLPYLQAQLEIIKPKIIVTLGRHSLNCFLPDLQISKVHGQPKRILINFSSRQEVQVSGANEVKNSRSKTMPVVLVPLFHPAAALYNGAMKQVLVDDFKKIPAIITKISQETTK